VSVAGGTSAAREARASAALGTDLTPGTIVSHRGGLGQASGMADPDPVTTEIVRNGLNAASEQMKRALMRTAFSPVIYEVLDFAVAIYDRQLRMLAQAPAQPLFLGTLDFCIRGAVEGVGGEEALEPGDILLYNVPYGTGAHPQDAGMVMPVFHEARELVGYTVIKAHWLDIGAKEPYCTDTVDVFQEGTLFPGVKLYSRGVLVSDIYRIALANSRVPKFVGGDINAEVTGVRTGAAALLRVFERFGPERFWEAIERMFDHSEAVVRGFFEDFPDGRYVGEGRMDSDGLSDDPVPFQVALEVKGSSVTVDLSSAPNVAGPMHSPLPITMSAARVAISLLAGGSEAPNEGHFRPIEVLTRVGSVFHPLPPAPCYLAFVPAMQATEAIYHALAQALPEIVPASSGGCDCALVWWGNRERTGEPWADGSPHPVGQGGHVNDDGASSLIHFVQSMSRFSPVEVWEARNPWLLEKVELAADSAGPGRHRGGLGTDFVFRMLEDSFVTSVVERQKTPPWGLAEGLSGRPNAIDLRQPDGPREPLGKVTLAVPKGAAIELQTGGGGGWGPPGGRDPELVRHDIREGYTTEAHARRHYPHAFVD
jgi:N-methylhydantoinase B